MQFENPKALVEGLKDVASMVEGIFNKSSDIPIHTDSRGFHFMILSPRYAIVFNGGSQLSKLIPVELSELKQPFTFLGFVPFGVS